MLCINSWAHLVTFLSGECNRAPFMTVILFQVIAWCNAKYLALLGGNKPLLEPVLSHIFWIAALSYNELKENAQMLAILKYCLWFGSKKDDLTLCVLKTPYSIIDLGNTALDQFKTKKGYLYGKQHWKIQSHLLFLRFQLTIHQRWFR